MLGNVSGYTYSSYIPGESDLCSADNKDEWEGQLETARVCRLVYASLAHEVAHGGAAFDSVVLGENPGALVFKCRISALRYIVRIHNKWDEVEFYNANVIEQDGWNYSDARPSFIW